MFNILIADSGSTKTDWAVVTPSSSTSVPLHVVQTQGINPIHQDDDTILKILRDELMPQLADKLVRSVFFYGSGVRPDQEARIGRLLQLTFPQAETLEAKSDLLGAARALCGRNEGIACILGTGANSCLYDGEKIVANTPALGYVLGDEGSGAVLGRLFLNALYKGRLYKGAEAEFEAQTGLTMADVITQVYRQPMANRWLASLSQYIHQRLDHCEVHELVVGNFRDFIRINVRPYSRPDLPLHAVGSIAYFYRDQLAEAAQAENCLLGRVMRTPMEGLASWFLR